MKMSVQNMNIEGQTSLRERALRDDALYAKRGIYNGTIAETFNAVATSDDTTVTMTLTNSVGGNLTMQFSDGVSGTVHV